MNCKEAKSLFSEFFGQELPQEISQSLEEHLAGYSPCKKEYNLASQKLKLFRDFCHLIYTIIQMLFYPRIQGKKSHEFFCVKEFSKRNQERRNMQKKLSSELEKHGVKGQIVSTHHLVHLEDEIEEKHRQGFFHTELYKEYLLEFKFKSPERMPDAQSLIVVAYPQPQIRIILNWKGKSYPVIIPPTYLYTPDRQVEKILSRLLSPQGYYVAKATLPLKLLAVKSGLGSYGKNNICYVPGMGSFHRLMAFYSDFPCSEDNWVEERVMESCKKCIACQRSCPTGAITSERFLLRAERCLTFLNEGPRDFPSWVDPAWHHCLVGCLYCQKVCIRNNGLFGWIEEKAKFSEQETKFILENRPFELLPSKTQKKLSRLDLVEYYKILPRNLRVLFDAKL
jgi:epoxyqueuosine reductase